MDAFNAAITGFFDLILKPFSARPVYGLLFLSFVAGIVLLKLFGMVSNQAKIKKTKDKIQAHILEIVLYRDNLGLSLKAAAKTLVTNLVYIQHAMFPLVVLMIPCLVLLAQMHIRYGSRPFNVGEETTIKIKADSSATLDRLSIATTEGLKVLPPPLKIKAEHEISWRVQTVTVGAQKITIQDGDHAYEKMVYVGPGQDKLSSARFKSPWKSFLYPGEKSLDPASSVLEMTVQYPEVSHHVFKFSMNWLVIFFVVSIVSGLLFKDLLKVEI